MKTRALNAATVFAVVLGMVLSTTGSVLASPKARGVAITTLSSHAELVTANDALVRIAVPDGFVTDEIVVVSRNGQDITAVFQRDAVGNTLTGLVTGLSPGVNRLVVHSKGQNNKGVRASLTLTNYPKEGPVFSGPHQEPFTCEAHPLPVLGTVLPKGSEPFCSIDTRIDYFYRPLLPTVAVPFKAWPAGATTYPVDLARTTNSLGVDVPYIVRMETGSANRGIYHTYVLHDPLSEPEPSFHTAPRGWNRRLIYSFGTGCAGGWYRQGVTTALVAETSPVTILPAAHFLFSNGYAVATSTLNNNSNNCNDVVAAETVMMVKERFIEAYGPPSYTMGFGLSGGAQQQQMIAENYPGLLDGIVPGGSFPDTLFAGRTMLTDVWLLDNYFTTRAEAAWTTEQQRAVTGLGTYATVAAPNVLPNARIIDPRVFCPPTLAAEQRYDAITNPRGVRCDVFSAYRNVFGIDPETGFVRRPIDNVGVQYGLAALNAGAISIAQFLDLNEKVGGFDGDGNLVGPRTSADLTAVRIAYRTGRLVHGGGGLASIPIIDYRAYTDDLRNAAGLVIGDVHLRYFSFAMRERLQKANGRTDNHVMLVEDRGAMLYNLANSTLLQSAFRQLDLWLDNLAKDASDDSRIDKVSRAKPATLQEGCVTRDAARTFVAETQTDDTSSVCGRLYPVNSFPRGVAGESIADDVIKCRLKAVDVNDYAATFTNGERNRLNAIFPYGVCDWSKRGIAQRPPLDTGLSFGPAGTVDLEKDAHGSAGDDRD